MQRRCSKCDIDDAVPCEAGVLVRDDVLMCVEPIIGHHFCEAYAVLVTDSPCHLKRSRNPVCAG